MCVVVVCSKNITTFFTRQTLPTNYSEKGNAKTTASKQQIGSFIKYVVDIISEDLVAIYGVEQHIVVTVFDLNVFRLNDSQPATQSVSG